MRKIIIFLSVIFILVSFFLYNKNETNRVVIENNNNKSEPEIKYAPESIPAMSEKEFKGSDLQLVKILLKNQFYTRYHITYKSEGLTISGIMNVPNGNGTYPILILNHGYVAPEKYRNGMGGLQREQDFFAKNGYVVFQSDYRNYAQSDKDPDNDVRPRTGYVEDVLNGINALKSSGLKFLNTDKIGMLGHSMGGGITINIMVTKPDAVNAYALLAPINSDYKINFDKWVATEFSETAKSFYDRYGTYQENPQFWESISAKNYLNKISRPIMVNQGTADSDVPMQWSRDLVGVLRKENNDVTYYEYEGEGHLLYKSQSLFMQRTLLFFDQKLEYTR